jgi:hypothetical protein
MVAPGRNRAEGEKQIMPATATPHTGKENTMETGTSNQPEQIDEQHKANATMVANGAMLIALQTAMRWAIIENTKMPNGDLQTLVARIAAEVAKAPADGFDSQDVNVGKVQVMKFVDIISGAIRSELASKNKIAGEASP